MPRWILTTGQPEFTGVNQPDRKALPARLELVGATPTSRFARLSITCPNATQAGPSGMIRFLARRLLNYLVLLALASFLTFCLTSVTFHPLDSFIQRHPQPPAEAIHAKAVQLGLDKPIPIRYANWVSGAVARRLRHDGDRSSRLPGAVAPDRGQPAAGGDRFGAGHGDRRHRGGVGRGPPVPAERPRHHGASRCSS